MASRVATAVTDTDVEAYRRDGAICIRRLFTPEEIALCAKGIDENLAHPSANAIVASRSGDPGFFLEDFCNWQRVAPYREFIFNSPCGATAARLMDVETVRLFHDHLLVKEPKTVQRTPWHQDQPYYNVDGFQNCSMWLPVDRVPRESTLEFIAGSHLGPWLMPRSFMNNEAKWFPEGSLADLPDIESRRDSYPILGWEIETGDAVFFHMLTLHGAGGTRERRRVLSVRFLGDDMRHIVRPWKTSPAFPGLDKELPSGAPMDHPLFPIIWAADGTYTQV
jgi:ectoine hydroxylase-related dioxygenase (phytanoyl-CoA dioxygenase family)